MVNHQEIDALIKLLDDPDKGVFEHVHNKLLTYGSDAVEQLENAWELSLDSILQDRIEKVLHRIQFNNTKQELNLWLFSGAFDLLHGALIINRYQYPELNEQQLINEIDEIKREAWLGLKEEMTALEKVKYLNHIFYNQFGFRGNTKHHTDPQNSYINLVMASKLGNQISLAIIYSTIAQKLDIPIYGINLPQHFILGYIDEHIEDKENSVLFYINAFNRGAIFGKHDVDQFLRQLNITPRSSFYTPCSNIEIVKRIVRNLISSYDNLGLYDKVEELNQLQEILDSHTDKA